MDMDAVKAAIPEMLEERFETMGEKLATEWDEQKDRPNDDRMSLEVRLQDLKEMLEQGIIDKGEHDREASRLLQDCASAGMDLDELYRHEEEEDFDRFVDAENYTIARRANNNMAKKMAYGYECRPCALSRCLMNYGCTLRPVVRSRIRVYRVSPPAL